MAELAPVPVFEDERGRLFPFEFGALPFNPARCFVVTAPGAPTERGGHRADCNQALFLLRGAVTVRLTRGDRVDEQRLAEPGSGALIAPTEFVTYRLETADTAVLVLADQPFVART